MNDTTKRFRVAFSFAGEKRDFIAQVAAILAARFSEAAILYDKFHEAEFARRDLGLYLPDLYHDHSDLVIVVVCRDYQQKEWCGLEWHAIFALLKKRKDSEVMLCRFDHATVQGLYEIAGFVELDDKTPDQAATRILERLALNEGKPRDFYHFNATPLRVARDVHPKTKLDFLERTSAKEKSTIATQPNTVPATAIDPTEVSIGIITALPKEFVAMKAALFDCLEYHVPGQGAGRRYIVGSISSLYGGGHRIALALADVGNNIASARAALLLEHFNSVDAIIMVGIAGGVPSAGKPDDHVRLGDVVVSNKKGVVQYDMVKLSEVRACPIPPSAKLIEAVRLLEAGELEHIRPWDSHIESILKQLKNKRPPQTSDKLHDSDDPTKKISHPKDRKRLNNLPRVFLGPVASANELLKDPGKRDALRNRFGVKAVEMEGSGIADATWQQERGYLVVRGICDYCDLYKNDVWQEYAAAVAAGYTKALIESIHPSKASVAQNPEIAEPVHSSWPIEPTQFKHDLADRAEREWPAVLYLLTSNSVKRILMFKGDSGYSKSALLGAAERYAKTLRVSTSYVDFKDTKLLSEANVLRELQLCLDRMLPSFATHGDPDRWTLRKSFRALKEPVLVLLDTYENASQTKELVEWIETQLLVEAEECEHLRFIIGGQKVPDSTRARWGNRAETIKLERIYNQRIWKEWVHDINPNVDERLVEGLVLGLEGLPGAISTVLGTCAKNLSRHS